MLNINTILTLHNSSDDEDADVNNEVSKIGDLTHDVPHAQCRMLRIHKCCSKVLLSQS